ncbi:MAG TPA: FISUMP domain-containing protein [bacterium]|nr:FISUMP domain-containing protein [bacterium]HPT29826.1 FISUMP domain-containing protein [bacterium]
MKLKQKGFTLIELLVVIAIIGTLATISVIALNTARAKSRDAKRVADVKQISTALELFFNDMGRYPTATEWNTGSIFSTSSGATSTYMQIIPTAPSPADGTCLPGDNSYVYSQQDGGNGYALDFCLGGQVASLTSGSKCATSKGVLSTNCCESFPVQYEGGPYDQSGTVRNQGGYYRTVLIGSQCWLKDNLNVGVEGTQTDDGIIEKHCDNCNLYGGQYNREEANGYPGWNVNGGQGICPDGWHIPSNADFSTLVNGLGGTNVAGGKLKQTGTVEGGTGIWGAPNTGATDESGFSAVPGFWAANTRGIYWGSNWASPYDPVLWLQYDNTIASLNFLDPTYNMSVRCLRD